MIVKSLSIKMKLKFAFYIIAVLILGLSIYNFVNINKVSGGFTQYNQISLDKDISTKIESNRLFMKMSLKDYLVTPNDSNINKFNTYYYDINENIKNAFKQINSSVRSNSIGELKEYTEKYKSLFLQVTLLTQEKEEIINENLVKNSKRIKTYINEIIEELKYSSSNELIVEASKVNNQFLEARVYSNNFLNSNLESDLNNMKILLDWNDPYKVDTI